jgi:ERCC4-related helicase
MVDDIVSKNVIDNYKGNDLANYLNGVLPRCDSGKFAIGYFFISGLDVIIENVKHLKELRILISNTTDQKTAETLMEGFKRLKDVKEKLEPDKYQSKEDIKKALNTTEINLKETLERMKQEDTEENIINILLDLMSPEKKIIKIRVITKEKLHAKAYLLKLKDDSDLKQIGREGYGIVGSSNLSVAGLQHSSELNVVTLDQQDYKHLSKWYDRLWEDAEEFTENFKYILGNSWAGKTFSPYDVYMKGMYHEMKDRLGEESEKMINPFGTIGPHLFDYQLRAVHQSVKVLEKNRGVIVADVVGLGKTFVTTGIVKIFQMTEGWVPLIICPPVLIPMWKDTMATYQIHAEFLSTGMLSQGKYNLSEDFRLRQHSLVIIDESHHFRHSNSNQYANLKKYLDMDEDRKVILITATPLGTSIEDVFNQIELFHKTDNLIIPVGTTSFKQFKKGVNDKKYDIRDLLKQIMIRRTRKYVLDTFGEKDTKTKRKYLINPKTNEKIFFPDRKLQTMRYDVQKTYNGQYYMILELLKKENLKFVRYGLGRYIKENKKNTKTVYSTLYSNGPALIGLIRMLLLKRLESSIAAFKNTVRKMIFINKVFSEAINLGFIPSGDLSQRILYESAGDADVNDVLLGKESAEPDGKKLEGILEEIKKSKSYFPISDFNEGVLKQDIKQDLETLQKIYDMVINTDIGKDDKFERLVKELKKYPKEKILIFSEYADTAKYIGKRLKTAFPKNEKEIVVIDSSTGGGKNQSKIMVRFAPKANNALITSNEKIEPIRILVATDVMSEGTNLQDAGTVINYDIHWNFVRLIQRAGRIDRIGQEREVINMISFLPDPKIESSLQLHARVKNCIDDYMRVIGDDNKVLEESEKMNPENMYAILDKQDAEILDHEDGILSADKLEKKFEAIKKSDKEYYDYILQMQNGVRTSSKMKISEMKTNLIVAAFQAGVFRKYYKIDDKEVNEINWTEMEEFLKEEKTVTKSLVIPEGYNKQIKKAFSVFEKTVKENKARIHSGISNEQIWVLGTLRKIISKKKNKKELDQIEYLITNFKKKISNIWTKRDLKRLKINYNEKIISENELIIELIDMIQIYPKEFHKIETVEEDDDIPTILYSKYVKLE